MNILQCVCVLSFVCLSYEQWYPVRLPATPLVVRTPYLSTWITSPAKTLYGAWPTFWNGNAVKGMAGLVRVDGTTYEFMGHPTQDAIGTTKQAFQQDLTFTAMMSIFTLTAGPIQLKVNFMSPVEPSHLKRMSIPASYIFVSAQSMDRKNHSVQVYFDVSGEWVGDSSQNATWSFSEINSKNGTLAIYDIQLKDQKPFTEVNDQAQWGTFKFFTHLNQTVTYESGFSVTVRSEFVSTGKLKNTQDTRFRAIGDEWPVFAFARDLGVVKSGTRSSFIYGFAHVRHPAIEYTTGPMNSLWEDYFENANEMIAFFYDDAFDAISLAENLYRTLIVDALRVGGFNYATIVSAAYRQVYGGIELVGTKHNPWLILKEISSDGNCQTVDVIYPHLPIQYYFNPTLIKFLLDPLFAHQEAGYYPNKYCMHDLGFHYPKCSGHPDGKDEPMEVEESANIILMTAAYVKASKDTAYAKQHYKILKQWAQYLVENGLFPGDALTTDDFLGRIKNSTNLALKAIVGIAAMSQLANASENIGDTLYYENVSTTYIKTWQKYAQDGSGKHVKLGYGLNGTWAMLYNIFMDKLLETNIVPKAIVDEQDAWYLQVAGKYGIPLQSGQQGHPSTWAKVDWEMFAAAASNSRTVQQLVYDSTTRWLNETNSVAAFADLIDVASGSGSFNNRPVIGGVYAPLALYRNKNKH